MSVICAVAFADKQVTRMTVWSERMLVQDDKNTPARWVDSLNLGRALQLAHYAYESRMRRPPPEIELKSLGVSVPHILALRYHTSPTVAGIAA